MSEAFLEHEEQSPELCTWVVPGMPGTQATEIVARQGEVTTIVGANGAGKSALGMRMHSNSGNANIRRMIAHRRLWFQSAGPDISPAQREQAGEHMKMWSRQPESRYVDRADSQRASIVLFDILAVLNAQNARSVALFRSGVKAEEVDREVGLPLLERLNCILADAGLVIRLKLTEKQTLNAVNVERDVEYPIFQMSDGEKSAVLLASEVLVAPDRSIQIIDEPERHLHRSISASLVAAIVADRPDCHFVVLTHDLDLAATLSTGGGQTYTLTECSWAGNSPSGWALFPVDASSEIPENARRAILGGRRNLLFIEGEAESLDVRLYQILFPQWALSPSGGADQVVRAVTGIRASQGHHWLQAHGIVDGDGRSDAERQALAGRGILSLPVSEVESLYYLDSVINAVAESQAQVLDRSAAVLKDEVREGALGALGAAGTLERLATKLAIAEIRRTAVDQLPTTLVNEVDPIQVSFDSPYPAILETIKTYYVNRDLESLVRLLPIRDSSLRNRVAIALGFRSIDNYETAARVRIRTDDILRFKLQTLLGPVPVGAAQRSSQPE